MKWVDLRLLDEGSVFNVVPEKLQGWLTDERVDASVGWGLNGAFAVRFGSYLLGGLEDEIFDKPLQTSSVLMMTVEENENSVVGLVSYMDSTLCFASSAVVPVNPVTRFAIDYSSGVPVMFTSTFHEDSIAELSLLTYSHSGERLKIADTVDLMRPSVVSNRVVMREKRYCDICVKGKTICHCSESMKRLVMRDKYDMMQSLMRKGGQGAVWRRYRNLVRCIGNCVGETELTTYALKDHKLVKVYTRQLGLTVAHIVGGLELDRIKLVHAQDLLLRSVPTLLHTNPENDEVSKTTEKSSGDDEEVEKVVCTECHMTFNRPYELGRHIHNVHLQLKPFHCHLCARGFSRRAHVAEHISAVHENRRDRACEECGHRFRTKSKLARHFRTVHLRLRPFPCDTCSASFCQKSDLQRHITAKHKNDINKQPTTIKSDTNCMPSAFQPEIV